MRINWSSKVDNLISISHELNLPLSSFIFIDDSALERDLIRQHLPEVSIFPMSVDPLKRVRDLQSFHELVKLNETTEDLHKLRQYKQESERKLLKNSIESLEISSWVEKLDIKLEYEKIYDYNYSRVLQLVNKTNQMNLSNKRYTDHSFQELLLSPSRLSYCMRAKDKFGEYGIIGFISIIIDENRLLITDFLFSCRIMGRYVEHQTLFDLLKKEHGKDKVKFEFVSTNSNQPMKEFLLNFLENLTLETTSELILERLNLQIKIKSDWNL
jgi:FkbH-like protein